MSATSASLLLLFSPYYELCTRGTKSYDSDYDGKGWRRYMIMQLEWSRNS